MLSRRVRPKKGGRKATPSPPKRRRTRAAKNEKPTPKTANERNAAKGRQTTEGRRTQPTEKRPKSKTTSRQTRQKQRRNKGNKQGNQSNAKQGEGRAKASQRKASKRQKTRSKHNKHPQHAEKTRQANATSARAKTSTTHEGKPAAPPRKTKREAIAVEQQAFLEGGWRRERTAHARPAIRRLLKLLVRLNYGRRERVGGRKPGWLASCDTIKRPARVRVCAKNASELKKATITKRLNRSLWLLV